jgi:Zn-dependent protease/CBS domain-containing protein
VEGRSPQQSEQRSRPREPGTLRLGQIAGVDVLVRASWFLVAGLIAVTMAPRIDVIAPELGGLVYVAGLAFAMLLYLSVLLHEASHAVMAQAFGMHVVSVTLHFLGGVTEIEGEAETPKREFLISVVGPIASAAVGAAAWAATQLTSPGLIEFVLEGLTVINFAVAILNLVPGLPLDGGKVLRAAVWALSGRPHLATAVAGWSGRVVAVLALTYPFLMPAAVVAMFLWTGSSQALLSARVRQRLPRLDARTLARRALSVAEDVPLAEAVRRARESDAGSLVVLGRDGSPLGVVNEQAVHATPEERRPWLHTVAVARRLEPGMVLPADLAGEALVRAMHHTPATEYLLVEADGSVYGVLVTSDVDAAFASA